MDYHLDLPVDIEKIKQFQVGDILYVSGNVFTARDEAHHKMLNLKKEDIPFDPSSMALFHCGPLMKHTTKGWQVVSAGPTTSSRMEIFEDEFIKKFRVNIIIGKGGMGKRTATALQKYSAVYTSYTGGAGALAAKKAVKVPAVYWLDELGMPEAVWVITMKEFGPLVVSMDSHGNSIYKKK